MYYTKTSDNVKIAFTDLNPCGRQTILCIHGWPMSQKIFEYQTDLLCQMDYRCICMDIRGFGDSDATAGGYTYDQLAKDCHELICSLGLNQFILCGFSMGAAICIRYLANYRNNRCCKLCLLGAAAPVFTRRFDSPYGFTPEEVNELILQTYRDRPAMAFDFCQKCFASEPSEPFRDWFNHICYDASGIATIRCAISLRDEDCRPDLKCIKVPTGIFHGVLDEICPFPLAEELQAGIVDSELFPFEQSGHCVFYDELDLFNERFIDFLGRG